MAATFVTMLYYNKICASERIDIKSKKCMICHYWYFLDCSYKYEPEVCNGCQDRTMIAYKLEKIAILNVKGVDYRCVTWNLSRSDTVS